MSVCTPQIRSSKKIPENWEESGDGGGATEEGRRQAAFGAWKFERLRGLKYARPLGFPELLQVKGGGGGCGTAA